MIEELEQRAETAELVVNALMDSVTMAHTVDLMPQWQLECLQLAMTARAERTLFNAGVN